MLQAGARRVAGAAVTEPGLAGEAQVHLRVYAARRPLEAVLPIPAAGGCAREANVGAGESCQNGIALVFVGHAGSIPRPKRRDAVVYAGTAPGGV